MNNSKQPFKCASGREIFYEYQSGQGAPLVFLNGLDDSMEVWKKTVQPLEAEGPRLFVDLLGQGESLRKELESGQSYDYQVSLAEQGQALLELFEFLKAESVVLIGNSYGGGVALWLASQKPQVVEKLILINPFILRLDLSFPWARLYAAQYQFLRKMTPHAFHSPFHIVESSYEKFIHNYMHFRFKKRIHDEKLRDVSVALSRGAMNFNSFQILQELPDRSVYLIFSEFDTLVPRSLYHEFWLRLPPLKKRNCFQLAHGDHLMLEQSPLFVCRTLKDILGHQLEPQAGIKRCWSKEETASGAGRTARNV